MRYYQIISEDFSSFLVNRILDLLTPIAGSGLEFITVDQLIDKIQLISTGMVIDREVIMNILDPENFPLIKSIEGDKIFLQIRERQRSITDQQKRSEADKIKDSATRVALKAVNSKI